MAASNQQGGRQQSRHRTRQARRVRSFASPWLVIASFSSYRSPRAPWTNRRHAAASTCRAATDIRPAVALLASRQHLLGQRLLDPERLTAELRDRVQGSPVIDRDVAHKARHWVSLRQRLLTTGNPTNRPCATAVQQSIPSPRAVRLTRARGRPAEPEPPRGDLGVGRLRGHAVTDGSGQG